MANLVKPKLSKIDYSNYSGIKATLNIGNTEWRITIKQDATESVFDEYSMGKKELTDLKAALADIDTTIDEHCHDAFLVEGFKNWKEEQRLAVEKKETERQEADAKELSDLVSEAKSAFAGTGFTLKVCHYSITISDGISEVTLHRDGYSESKRWVLDAREWHDGGRYGKRFSTGERKSSVKIAKLVDFVKQTLKNRTDIVNSRKNANNATAEIDAEMLAMGWEPGCQGAHIGYNAETKQSEYKKISNNGTTYKKDNVTIYVKRVDNILKVTKYSVDSLNINVSEFKGTF